MKTSIPSDVWEKKKALIAKLYKDEEWPLKQVIKKIRSDNFNPSETQLRSRLKKWRVTKPSRQTRKKSPDGQSKSSSDESENEGSSPTIQSLSNSPRYQSHTIPHQDSSHETYAPSSALGVLDSQHLSETWALPAVQQPSSCPSEHYGSPDNSPAIPHPSSYDALFASQTPTMTHAYNGTPFAVTDSGMQRPVSSIDPAGSMQWPGSHWYSVPPGAVAQPAPIHFYSSAPQSSPSTSSVDLTLQATHIQSSPPIYSLQSGLYSSLSHYHVPDPFDGAKHWELNIPHQYTSDTPARCSRSEQLRTSEYSSKSTTLPPRAIEHSSSGLVTPLSHFFNSGQHPMICAPIYHHPGQENLRHGPPSIEF